ncbi:MAG: hypothetical protein CMC05_08440 [Flavobacteriaceae bacterium]|nr:hypothetical protein [Flavobacteriaceae bacterium]MBD10237.1 hypothetical protein [Flavobacteriaceae bacterium]|tara:strand:+ start:1881 stop:2234 length:354 start_codon:yes stop_codon:yes gene_type:complete
MKTNNLFTKTVLLVIALNLTFLSLDKIDLLPKAYANENTNINNSMTNRVLVPINEDGSINVKIISSEVPLDITGKIDLSDTLSVNLTQINGQRVPQTTYYFRDGTEGYPMLVTPTHY